MKQRTTSRSSAACAWSRRWRRTARTPASRRRRAAPGCTAIAVAKAILPWLPAPELSGLLARMRFARHTPKTIVTRAAFEAELRRIRAAGYAVDDEEHIEGIRCIAMPVFGHSAQVLGSLCTLGPKSRMTYQRLRELRAPLADVARQLSERLGYTAA